MLTAGSVLKQRRLELNKTLKEVSEDTKVQEKYLNWIENDEFENFDTEVFLTGYIKIVSKYLHLNTDKILAIYRRSIEKQKELSTPKQIIEKDSKFALSPTFATISIVTISILAIVTYIGIQFYNFQKDPILQVSEPESNTIVEESSVTIKGKTEENIILTINDENISLNDDFTFEYNYKLIEGVNDVVIRATKENNESKETQKILKLTYTPIDDETNVELVEEEEEPEVERSFRVTTTQDAWIQIITDDKQEIAEIVPNGFNQKFTFSEEFSITTGKSSFTKIFISDDESPYIYKENSGVVALNCKISDNTVTCQEQ